MYKTPIYYAIEKNAIDIVSMMIDKGADINIVSYASIRYNNTRCYDMTHFQGVC